jgi:hypothetical protein
MAPVILRRCGRGLLARDERDGQDMPEKNAGQVSVDVAGGRE